MVELNVEAMFATINGKLDTISAEQKSQSAQLMAAIDYGDRSNQQLIQSVHEETKRAHGRIDAITDPRDGELARRDAKIEANRRLAWTTIAAPMIVMLVGALLLYNFGLR